MKKRYLLAALLSASLFYSCSDSVFTAESGNGGATAPIVNLPSDAVKGELFVKFKPEVEDILDKAGALSRNGKMSRSTIPSVDEVLDIAGGYSFERVFPVDVENEGRTRKSGLHLWYLVRFSEDADPVKVAQDMAKLAEVATVEFNREIKRAYDPTKRAKGVSEEAMNAARTLKSNAKFNDPKLGAQWHYINNGTVLNRPAEGDGINLPEFEEGTYAGFDVNCKEAWEICTGDPSIIVAVLDEGVMYSHPDLKANMWVNPKESVVGGTQDMDGNGYRGDVHGYNFVDDSGLITWSDPNDSGHGTHVAGTIAAVNNNGMGVCGVAGGSGNNDGVKIMSCQIFSGAKGATMLAEAKAIKYAADNGAVILQCSWGYNSGLSNPINYIPGPTSDEAWASVAVMEKEVLDYFINNAGDPNGVIDGGIVIFAAGNEYAPMAAYPGAYEKCISVASIGPDGTPAPYSNFSTPSGSKNMITAPGGDGEGTKRKSALVLSTMPHSAVETGGDASKGAYGYMEGTSMACPHVSGVAALGLSHAVKLRKHFRAEDYRRLILESVRPIDTNYGDITKAYWYGWASMGESAPCNLLELRQYKGKMGGLIDAKKVLENVAGESYGSQPMKVPNVYVSVEETEVVDLVRVFGSLSSVSCEVANKAIAEVVTSNTQLSVKGLAKGSTKAVVSVTLASGETQEQSFVITVRKDAGNGWM